MPKEPWYDSDNPGTVARGVTWRGFVWLIVVLAVFGAIGGVTWAIKVATSEVKGAGDVQIITNDAQNRVNSQEWFHGQLAAVKAADAKLADAEAGLTAAVGTADEAWARTNFTGLRNRCLDMVQAYNAETKKVTRGKWLDSTLPYVIDDTDRTTDCKADKEINNR